MFKFHPNIKSPNPNLIGPSAYMRHRNRKDAIIYAIQNNDMTALEQLLEMGFLPANLGYDMMRCACFWNRFEAVQLLWQYGCSTVRPRTVKPVTTTPLYYALYHKNLKIAMFLTDKSYHPIKEVPEE
ncbi:hypothetical protein JTE90_023649 [Oedothorax gibbosus]|uniref:Uncharacterized protein n=1 Tax=Oedothorax gibbosus TaxID=931172 RepID=A0AAV6V1B8_9ARAC|nr:hypothetical protein JTE90_023649 [Oedothorax gibbosus]